MKKYLVAFLVLGAIVGGAVQVKAASLEDLWKEVMGLKQEVTALQAQLPAQALTGMRAATSVEAGASVSVEKRDTSASVMAGMKVPLSISATPAQAPRAALTKTLQSGVTDAEVKVVQSILKDTGYLKAEATGYFGKATETALKQYQAANGLEATGTVGPRTRTILTATTLSATAKPSDTLSIMAQSAGCSAGARFSASTGKACPGTEVTTPSRTTAETPAKNSVACSASSGYVYSGKWGSFGSGNGQFDMPYELDADANGNVYVPDTHANTVQKFDANGKFVLAFGSISSGNSQLDRPYGLGVDASGNVYVADTYNSRIVKFSGNGVYISQFGSGVLNHPGAVKFDKSGNIYVSDIDNLRIAKFDVNGNLLLTFGSAGTGNGQFTDIRGIAIAANGNIYVADNGGDRIEIFNSNGTYVSQFGTRGTGNGQFMNPADLHFDSNGFLYVVEAQGNRIQKFDANGTYLGQFGSLGSGSGQISYPLGMTIDAANNLYVSDWKNSRIVKFSPCSTSVLTTPLTTTPTKTSATIPACMQGVPSITSVDSPINGGRLNHGGNVTVTWKWCNIPVASEVLIAIEPPTGLVQNGPNGYTSILATYNYSTAVPGSTTGYYQATTAGGSDLAVIPANIPPGQYRINVYGKTSPNFSNEFGNHSGVFTVQ